MNALSFLSTLLNRSLVAGVMGIAALFAGGAHAQNITDAELLAVVEAEQVLNGVITAQGRFTQQDSLGGQASGEVAIWRPGRLRFDYDAPSPTLILADGYFVMSVDRELENVAHQRISRSPLYFLLDQRVEFTKGLNLVDVVLGDQLLEITVQRQGREDEGFLTLLFHPQTKELLGWRTVDAQGVTTLLQLEFMSYGVPMNEEAFRLPAGYGRDDRDRN